MRFPGELNNSKIREVIRRFQVNVENTIKHMDHVCYCYSRFVDLLELESILDNDAVLIAEFETDILYCCDFDFWECYSGSVNFCYDY